MKKSYIILALIPLFTISCVVSKKKYEELEYAKRRSDSKVRILDEENGKQKLKISNLDTKLNLTLDEFNDMKNNMSESNAKKDSEIDALSTEMFDLASDTTLLNSSISENVVALRDLKFKLVNSQKSLLNYKKEVSSLKSKLEDLKFKAETAKKDLRWETKKMMKLKENNQSLLLAKDNNIESLKKQIIELEGKASWLRKVNLKNKTEIEKLTNQRNLYKREMNKNLTK